MPAAPASMACSLDDAGFAFDGFSRSAKWAGTTTEGPPFASAASRAEAQLASATACTSASPNGARLVTPFLHRQRSRSVELGRTAAEPLPEENQVSGVRRIDAPGRVSF